METAAILRLVNLQAGYAFTQHKTTNK